MTDEELERFALVLKECERIRALIARVTSSRWENSFFTGSGLPFTNSLSPR